VVVLVVELLITARVVGDLRFVLAGHKLEAEAEDAGKRGSHKPVGEVAEEPEIETDLVPVVLERTLERGVLVLLALAEVVKKLRSPVLTRPKAADAPVLEQVVALHRIVQDDKVLYDAVLDVVAEADARDVRLAALRAVHVVDVLRRGVGGGRLDGARGVPWAGGRVRHLGSPLQHAAQQCRLVRRNSLYNVQQELLLLSTAEILKAEVGVEVLVDVEILEALKVDAPALQSHSHRLLLKSIKRRADAHQRVLPQIAVH